MSSSKNLGQEKGLGRLTTLAKVLAHRLRFPSTASDDAGVVNLSLKEVVEVAQLIDRMFSFEAPREIYHSPYLEDDLASDVNLAVLEANQPIFANIEKMSCYGVAAMLNAAHPRLSEISIPYLNLTASNSLTDCMPWEPVDDGINLVRVLPSNARGTMPFGIMLRLVTIIASRLRGVLDRRYELGLLAGPVTHSCITSVLIELGSALAGLGHPVAAIAEHFASHGLTTPEFILHALCRGELELVINGLAVQGGMSPEEVVGVIAEGSDPLDDLLLDAGVEEELLDVFVFALRYVRGRGDDTRGPKRESFSEEFTVALQEAADSGKLGNEALSSALVLGLNETSTFPWYLDEQKLAS